MARLLGKHELVTRTEIRTHSRVIYLFFLRVEPVNAILLRVDYTLRVPNGGSLSVSTLSE